MQVYNLDEMGVTIIHRLGKVVTEVGRCNVTELSGVEIVTWSLNCASIDRESDVPWGVWNTQ